MQDGDEFKVGEERYVVRDGKLYLLKEVMLEAEVAPQLCTLPHYAQWWPQPCNRPHYPYSPLFGPLGGMTIRGGTGEIASGTVPNLILAENYTYTGE